jgi:uncharacterized protein YjiS (DUF1127 family)
MEMHTPRSLYAIHGIAAATRPHAGSRWISSLVAEASRMRLPLRREREIRCIVAALEALDDYLLHDLGIRRSDIEHVARARGAELWRRCEDAPC